MAWDEGSREKILGRLRLVRLAPIAIKVSRVGPVVLVRSREVLLRLFRCRTVVGVVGASSRELI